MPKQLSYQEKRSADAKKKRAIALRMLERGKGNEAIKDKVRAKFGTSIGPDDLAKLREQLGISGPNRGSKQKKKAKKAAPSKRTKTAAQKSKSAFKAGTVKDTVLVFQDNGTSAQFKAALQTALNQMPAEGIQAFAVTADGLVRVQQVNEFMLTPPSSKVLGLLGSVK